jgi:hypothetical protein
MTTNEATRAAKRTAERTLVRKAKKQKRIQRTDESQILLLTLEYVEEERNEDGKIVEVDKTKDIFVPNLKDITAQEMTRVIRVARKQGDDAATDLLLETLLGIEDYEFLLYEIDPETFDFVGRKAVEYVFGTVEAKDDAEVEEGK